MGFSSFYKFLITNTPQRVEKPLVLYSTKESTSHSLNQKRLSSGLYQNSVKLALKPLILIFFSNGNKKEFHEPGTKQIHDWEDAELKKCPCFLQYFSKLSKSHYCNITGWNKILVAMRKTVNHFLITLDFSGMFLFWKHLKNFWWVKRLLHPVFGL